MTDQVPAEFLGQMADLQSHHIEGIAYMGNVPFNCPIITHVEGNLWQGGTPADAGGVLPSFFRYVLNLCPWEEYEVPAGTEVRTHRLYDSGTVPDKKVIEELAAWVNEKRALGPTLVHCQAGLNRSALIVAFALIKAGRTPTEAVNLLREQRSPAVLCNPAFATWLRAQG